VIPDFQFFAGRHAVRLIPQPRYVWAAVAGAVVAAGTAVYSAQQQKKAMKAPGAAAPIDIQDVQKQAIQGNIANQADIEKLVASTNKFQQGQALSLMEQAMPGYKSLTSKLSGQAEKLATSPYEVPADVQANLQRLAAEKGISTGRSGQAGQFSLLRDLGVNQLQYGQQNLQTASGLTSLLASIAPKVNPMSPMSMYISPEQALNIAVGNKDREQGALNSQAALANAKAQVDANMWGQIGSAAMVAGSAYAGHLKDKTVAPAASNVSPYVTAPTSTTQYNPFPNASWQPLVKNG
jgi:hypothetical protein